MKAYIIFMLILAVSFCLIGCQISDKKAKVMLIKPIESKPKDFVLIGDREYQAEFTAALAKYGFNLKPISIRQSVTELQSPKKIVKYKEVGTRFAIDLTVKHDYMYTCVFSSNHIVDVTMSIIDIEENNTVLIIKQKAPDGECPPLTPAWELLAAEFANVWGVKEGSTPASLASPKH